MCRSIKTLHRSEAPPTEEEIHAAALQFVRKVSGYRAPARRNEAAFEAAVDDISAASRRLLETLAPRAPRPAAPPDIAERVG
ncbi:MAG: DUF2277 domain-containing protein [Chloroflexi bacterium]|jgi:hypothetical protein|nr:DUF2277 domain-containing protein [Chloroflexota bacterium]MBA3796442.1 DUF2277 domain-containing protein [Chloroflexota bacterium]